MERGGGWFIKRGDDLGSSVHCDMNGPEYGASEFESDGRAIGNSGLFSDDEAEGPHYLVDGHLGTWSDLMAWSFECLTDILLVQPAVEDPDLHEPTIGCLADWRQRKAVQSW